MSSLTMIFLLPVFLCSMVLVVQSFTMPPRNDPGSQVQHEPRMRHQQHKQQQSAVAAAAGTSASAKAEKQQALNHLKHRAYSVAVSGARKTTRLPFTRNPPDDSDDHLYAPASSSSDPLPGLPSHEDQETGDMMLQETRGDDDHNSELRSYAPTQRQHRHRLRDPVTPDFYSSPSSSSSLSSPPASKDMIAESSHHHDQHEWLDMGAYSGKQGSFGWYADFPVGGIDAKGHGRRR